MGGTGGADGRNGRCSWEEREVLVGGGCWWVVGGGRCTIWQHTCLPRGSCQILLLQHTLSSETQEFCTAILDTFDTGVSSEAGNPIQAEEECISIPSVPSGDIPCVPSESNRNHSHSSSLSSCACAPTINNEARLNFDSHLDDRDAMMDHSVLS